MIILSGFESMFLDMERSGRSQTLFSIRYDTINLDYGMHNNTCVGVPSWGNTVDISSCDHYLMCSNTRTYRVPCPPSFDGSKLYYNPEKNFCDFKRNVNCTDGIRPTDRPKNNTRPVIITPPPIVTRNTESTRSVELPESINPCRNRGNLNSVDPLSCDHYFTCRASKVLSIVRCPLSWNGKTLFYNVGTDQCLFRKEVNCNESNKGLASTNSQDFQPNIKTPTAASTRTVSTTEKSLLNAKTTHGETSPGSEQEENNTATLTTNDKNNTDDPGMKGSKSSTDNNLETTTTHTASAAKPTTKTHSQ